MDAKLVEFSNLLRQNGLRVSLAESMDMLRALDVVGLPDRQTVRATLRATMVKRSVDLPTFETLFDLFFSGLADAIKELTAATASALEMSEEEFQRFLEELKKRLAEVGTELSPLARALLAVADVSKSLVRGGLQGQDVPRGAQRRLQARAEKSFSSLPEEETRRMQEAVPKPAQRLRNVVSTRRKRARRGKFDSNDT